MRLRVGLLFAALLSSPAFGDNPAGDDSPKDDAQKVDNNTQVPLTQGKPPTDRRVSPPRLPTLSGEPAGGPASGPNGAALDEDLLPEDDLIVATPGGTDASRAASPGSGPGPAGSPLPGAEDRRGANTAKGRVDSLDSAVKTKAGAAGKSSLNNAVGKAAGLMRTMRRDEDPPPEGDRGPRPHPEATRAGDPSGPVTPADLALSYDAGFKGPFERAGLRVVKDAEGRANVVRKDGSAASPGDVATLVQQVNSEPRALMKRPDFFNVIPRQSYDGLREAHRENPSRPEFKHVSLSPDERDLAWDESCSRVSGKCNEHAKEPAYKRGEQVSPESLLAMWEDILTPPAGADVAHRKLGRKFDSRSAWDRIAGSLGKLGAAFGWEDGGPAKEAGSEGESGPSTETNRTGVAMDAGDSTSSPARRTHKTPPAAPRVSARASLNWWWILAFPGAALSLWAVWINKREV